MLALDNQSAFFPVPRAAGRGSIPPSSHFWSQPRVPEDRTGSVLVSEISPGALARLGSLKSYSRFPIRTDQADGDSDTSEKTVETGEGDKGEVRQTLDKERR